MNSTVTIRPEREADFETIYNLVHRAFETAKVSGGDEPEFIVRMRADENYIPGLALVAESGKELIGHIMLTRTLIRRDTSASRKAYEVLLLAPLAVRLEERGQGVGAALVREAFRLGTEMGFGAIVLVGDPGYYGRLGFRPASEYGIRPPAEDYAPYLQVYELRPGVLDGASGTVDLPH